MLKLLFITMATAILARGGEPLDLASHSGRTLPVEAYRLMHKGDGRGTLSWAWRSPAFKPKDGYAVIESRWDWDVRSGLLLHYLREQLDLQSNPRGKALLSVRVVYFAVNSVGPQIVLEGSITREGQALGYFVESVILENGEPLVGLVDAFMRDFTAYVR